MASVLILGYGNTLRGDDGIGWRAAEMLSASDLGEGVEVRALHQLAPELADCLVTVRRVLFVDATRRGEVGEVCYRRVEPDAGDAGFTHQVTPSTLLALTRQLHCSAPEAFEVSLCGESFDLSDDLSPRVAAAMPKLLQLCRDLTSRDGE